MDLITVIIIGVIVAASGVMNPNAKDPEEVAKAPEPQVTTPVVQESKPEPEPEPEPEPTQINRSKQVLEEKILMYLKQEQ